MTFWPLFVLASLCDPAPALEGKRLFEQGRFALAEQHFRRAVAQPCGPAQRVADQINLAATLRERNLFAEAKQQLPEASTVANLPVEIQITFWNCLALLEEHTGRATQAEAAYRRAQALLTPATPARLAMQAWTNFARLRLKQGLLREAELALEQPNWQHDRPSAYYLNLAELRRMQGRPRDAERILQAMPAGNLPAQIRGAVANNLASLAARRGAHREAEQRWHEAIAAFREAYGPAHPTVGRALNNLAAHLVARKRHAFAESLYREAIAMNPDPRLLNNLAALLHDRARHAEAEALYQQALAQFERPSRDAIQLHGNYAIFLSQQRRPDEASAQFQQLLQLLPLALPADEPVVARYLFDYEQLLRQKREAAEAERISVIAMRYRVRSTLRSAN
ncbi:MAG: tetratricopeptide repeat protein [Bryobacterales bacterium]|nr:tetratricopeptide repeat protein [Bryobacterales bacterium]